MQRPELFGAALIDAGIFDMTRFNRFTVGATWIPEFGSPDRPSDLRALLAYSPLQNVEPDVRVSADADHASATTTTSSTPASQLQVRRRAAGGAACDRSGAAPRRLRRRARTRHSDARNRSHSTPTVSTFLANAIRPPRYVQLVAPSPRTLTFRA